MPNGWSRYHCSVCGAYTTAGKGFRPNPGTCSRKGKTKDGRTKPHTWKRVTEK